MHVIRLDHATINTADLRASLAFYGHFLGMKPGWRPPFDIGGAWLYPEGGDYAILHLIEREKVTPKGGMFDHVAFRGTGLGEYLAKVKATGGWYLAAPVPGTPLVQVQHFDPNQVLIEVNFENERLEVSDVSQ
jgi:catechol 2,3-dioxygenase-like lactoylglutathione lyase family enzyme